MTARPLLSVVAPVYCEEDGLREFFQRTTKALTAIEPGVDHELIFVDNASEDRSPHILRELCNEDERVRVLTLSRNFGHQIAITSGIDHAEGDAVVVIDSDLQDPPEVIAEMVERWRDGAKVVYGVRTNRLGENRAKVWAAKAFYRSVNRLSDTPLPLDTGDFRLMDRQVVAALREIREENRYIRGLVSWVGFSQCAVAYEREPRYSGTTKFNFGRLMRFAIDGITSFSEKPLRLSMQIGLLTTILTLAMAAWILVGKLASPESAIPGYTSLTVIVLFLGGVQLISIGLLGEYLGRVYRETKRRPLYIVADRINFPDRKTRER